jgi:hypothetical protein
MSLGVGLRRSQGEGRRSGGSLAGFDVDRSACISESRYRACGRLPRPKRGNMNWVERLSVRAKHWQIFLLFVMVFAVGELPLIGNLSAAARSQEGYADGLILTEIAAAVAGWCFLLWLWSLGSFLTSIVPPALKLKRRFFLFTILCPALYVLVSIGLFQSIDRKLFVMTIPVHLFAVFCMFCNLYFVAEGLVIAETDERASFFDCLGPFLLLWFAIIGVWFIQPRINRLYAEKRNAGATAEATAI